MSDRELLVISAFARALSHRLRTPLSVISNDLQYLKDQLPSGECDRGLEKLKQISDILDGATATGALPLSMKRVSLTELVKLAPFSSVTFEGEEELFIEADSPRVGTALRLISELLPGAETKFRVSNHCGYLSFRTPSPVYVRGKPESVRRHDSFTAVFNYLFEIDSIQSPIIDSILFAHECIVTLSFHGEDLLADIVFTAIA